jgi:pimeloyl-ACP methyl ester carboxylesterase
MSYEPGRVPWQEDVQLRGVRHRLTWWGERTSDPIVLLHGFLDCGATWQFLVDRLPASWTLVAPDWRGFGDSDGYPAVTGFRITSLTSRPCLTRWCPKVVQGSSAIAWAPT